ncbi:ABC transporter substrate-binding protein [Pukyongiella litopenaei]|uniref:Peptide ABC transporter substrate-binding protein n=1 Tax=Pukyongiella litopenaei TaxID=2605946 RepID=A0A2S0MPT4_9RHOB|nr:ABC transporter substrate-binding protein [Pukyongiella litopenaei]AVO37878.1 peptide ABC transporter substrate-binding protein [Pukyongiella litopenaei]
MTRIDRRLLFTTGAAAALMSAAGVTMGDEPRRGGVLRLALPRDGSLGRVARGAGFETLTEIAPDGVLRGELADSWRGSADARVWHIGLRGDAWFHDGTRLVADAVAESLAVHADRLGLVRAGAEGPRSLVLELDRGNPDLPIMLADAGFAIDRNGTGTGCYRIVEHRGGRYLRADRVAGHHREDRAGWVDRIEALVIPDAAVRAEALRDGHVDVAALPLPDGLHGRGGFRFHPSARNMALAASTAVGVPPVIGTRGALDDGRIAERWWLI